MLRPHGFDAGAIKQRVRVGIHPEAGHKVFEIDSGPGEQENASVRQLVITAEGKPASCGISSLAIAMNVANATGRELVDMSH